MKLSPQALRRRESVIIICKHNYRCRPADQEAPADLVVSGFKHNVCVLYWMTYWQLLRIRSCYLILWCFRVGGRQGQEGQLMYFHVRMICIKHKRAVDSEFLHTLFFFTRHPGVRLHISSPNVGLSKALIRPVSFLLIATRSRGDGSRVLIRAEGHRLQAGAEPTGRF